MKDEWYEFYKGRIGSEGYQTYVEKRYEPFIEVINILINLKHDSKNLRTIQKRPFTTKIQEVGCGIGTISKAVYQQNPSYTFYLVDKSKAMIAAAIEHFGKDRAINDLNQIIFLHGDVLYEYITPSDVCFSHGLLEHFDPPDINKIIMRLKAYSACMVHYVPTDKYGKPSFGDERLWSVDKWRRICRPDWVETFNDGHDLMMVWDNDL